MNILPYLIVIANRLDSMGHSKLADDLDELLKNSEQLENIYYPDSQKNNGAGNINQEIKTIEEPDDINVDEEGSAPGKDNIIIDKNDNPEDVFGVMV